MPLLNYSPAHVIGLFDDMAQTYGTVNLLSSLGFSYLWRKACIQKLDLKPNHHCADLMCGMGEATAIMAKIAGHALSVDAIDFCSEMIKRCHRTVSRHQMAGVSVHTCDVFDLPLMTTYDRICCSFGLKTLNDEQLRRFARLIRTSLRPSGRASFIEIMYQKIGCFVWFISFIFVTSFQRLGVCVWEIPTAIAIWPFIPKITRKGISLTSTCETLVLQ